MTTRASETTPRASDPEPRSRAHARRTYQARCEARRATLAEAHRRARVISNARLATALVALAMLGLAWADRLHPAWLLLPALVFSGLVVAHERAFRAAERAERAVAYFEAGLRRFDGTWPGTGAQGTEYLDPEHPYARDLDLFGRGSLFELLCTTRTRVGATTLARWIAEPAPLTTVRARQRAIESLRDAVDLREDLAVAGDAIETEVDPAALTAWGRRAPSLDAARARRALALAWTVPIAEVVAAAVWAAGLTGPGLLLGTLALTYLVHRRYEPVVGAIEAAVQEVERELAIVAAVVRRLEHESFEDPMLSELARRLVVDEGSASREIARLGRLAGWMNVRRGQLVGIVVSALLWGVHFGLAIERWRAKNGPAIERWFGALGELEALCALSAYAYEHPEDPFPELVETGPLMVGVALGHPLLPPERCVRNDVRLDAELQALVISGSNMSGKSTYLRTVGLNAVLALAGAPVRAASLRVSFLRVGASLRIVDSLHEGTSHFYAEIQRLRRIEQLARDNLLFLLDEILHGTNSHDRRIGAFAVLRALLDAGAIGLVTTHDLALAADADALGGRVGNVHFSDDIVDGELHFDYRLRPGVVRTSNALELMRSVGLPV